MPGSIGSLQKEKSVVLGSPIGHTHLERDQLILRRARRSGNSEVISSVFLGFALTDVADDEIGDWRLGKPSLWAFPATALRVTFNLWPI